MKQPILDMFNKAIHFVVANNKPCNVLYVTKFGNFKVTIEKSKEKEEKEPYIFFDETVEFTQDMWSYLQDNPVKGTYEAKIK